MKGKGPPKGKRRTILLVDDEPDILSSVQSLVENLVGGVDVVTAECGQEGLQILATRSVELIMSDYRMPDMDGIEFLSRCRELRPEAPRIMLTAFADAEPAQRAAPTALVDEFISKVLAPPQFLEHVRRLLGIAQPMGPSGRALQGAG